MDDNTCRNSLRRSVIFGVIQGFAGLAVCMVLVTVVPRFEKIFRDFKAELPATTKMVIAASHFAYDYWFVAIPIALLWGFANFAVVYALDSSRSGASTLACWIIGLLAVLSFLAFVFASLYLPLFSLIDSLTGR